MEETHRKSNTVLLEPQKFDSDYSRTVSVKYKAQIDESQSAPVFCWVGH